MRNPYVLSLVLAFSLGSVPLEAKEEIYRCATKSYKINKLKDLDQVYSAAKSELDSMAKGKKSSTRKNNKILNQTSKLDLEKIKTDWKIEFTIVSKKKAFAREAIDNKKIKLKLVHKQKKSKKQKAYKQYLSKKTDETQQRYTFYSDDLTLRQEKAEIKMRKPTVIIINGKKSPSDPVPTKSISSKIYSCANIKQLSKDDE